jgi:hypothetical protein
VYCRHALDSAQSGKVRTLRRPVVAQKDLPRGWKIVIAAMVALTVGVSGWNLYRMFAPDQSVGAVVKSVSGEMFTVGGSGGPIFAGRRIDDRQHVRTREKSDALIRLVDGSEVELNARSEVWFSRASQETTVHLTRGSIIVHAAKQRKGALHVATADCLVTVKGTIFSVTGGVKGSRVSVVEGAVKVDQGGQSRLLHPGEQTTTSSAIQSTSVTDDISWSRNSGQYLALLGEFSTMTKQLAQAPQPGLRYSSKVAELAPQNTLVYASMPNIGPLLSEANRIFNERLSQSQVLSQWWSEHRPENGPSLDDIVQRVRTFSDYLGDEIALAITMDHETKTAIPLIMAEVTKPGLREFLQAEAQQMNAQSGKTVLQVLDEIPRTAAQPGNHLVAFLSGNYLFLSTGTAPLIQADAAVKNRAPLGAYRLFRRVNDTYKSGAGWLLAADMEQIRSTSVRLQEGRGDGRQRLIASGIDSLDAVVLERKDVNGTTQNLAALNFEGGRSGMAGWLATPAPMGAIDFMSPNASMVAAAVMKDHGAVVWEVVNSLKAAHPEFEQQVEEFANNKGWSLFSNMANALGSDFAVAIDGALVPVPSWKVAVEVYNVSNFQWAVEQVVDGVNQQPDMKVKLVLSKTDLNGRTFYSITADGIPVAIHYTFVDNYLVAAASRDLLTQAVQNRQTGYTLTRSENFRSQFPADGRTDFSAIMYFNAGPALKTVADGLAASNAVPPAQKQAIAALAANSKPGLVYAYVEADRILVSSNGSFFGLNIDTLSLPAVLSAGMNHQLNARVARAGVKPN